MDVPSEYLIGIGTFVTVTVVPGVGLWWRHQQKKDENWARLIEDLVKKLDKKDEDGKKFIDGLLSAFLRKDDEHSKQIASMSDAHNATIERLQNKTIDKMDQWGTIRDGTVSALNLTNDKLAGEIRGLKNEVAGLKKLMSGG